MGGWGQAMNLLHYVLPWLSQALVLAVLLTLIVGQRIQDSRIRLGVIVALLLTALFVSVNGLSVSQWLRSVVGDLSVISLIILTNILSQRLLNFSLLKSSSRKYLVLGVVLVGVVFYPLALGLSAYDPYQLGYAPLLLMALLVLLSLLAWFQCMRDLALVLLLPLVAYNLHLLESSNLWDYLLDPIVLIYALVQSVLEVKFFRLEKKEGKA
jgi:hypothetical protein